jgi:hypothetical protein
LLALRPRPSVFIAEGGTNFKGSHSALQDIVEKGQINLAKAQSHFNTKFQFAPPRAPHFQSLVEKFAEATKAAIHSAVHAHTPTDNEGRGCYAVIAFVIAESKQREAFKIPEMRVPANKAKQTQLIWRRAAGPSDNEPTDNKGRGCYAVIAFVIAESCRTK